MNKSSAGPWLVRSFVLVIGAGVILAFYTAVRGGSRSGAMHASAIGAIESVKGDAEKRAPDTAVFVPATSHEPYLSGEQIFTQPAAEAVMTFDGGVKLRLEADSRFVAERDALKNDAVVGVLLDGRVTVLDVGTPGRFRLMQNGKQIALSSGGSQDIVPILPSVPTTGAPKRRPTPPNTGIVVSATVADDSSAPSAAQAAAEAVNPSAVSTNPATGDLSSDVITNDDIVRQLRMQMGFFQHCYLTYLHRLPGHENGGGPAPGGTVVTSFKIMPSGKVTETRVERSSFKDDVLHRCITEVIERTPFRAFKGDPIPVVEFPITLQ